MLWKIVVSEKNLFSCQSIVTFEYCLSHLSLRLRCFCVHSESSEDCCRFPSYTMQSDQSLAGNFSLTERDASHSHDSLISYLLAVAWHQLRASSQYRRSLKTATSAARMLTRQSARLQSSSLAWSSEICSRSLLAKERHEASSRSSRSHCSERSINLVRSSNSSAKFALRSACWLDPAYAAQGGEDDSLAWRNPGSSSSLTLRTLRIHSELGRFEIFESRHVMNDAALRLIFGCCTEHPIDLLQLIASVGEVEGKDKIRELANACRKPVVWSHVLFACRFLRSYIHTSCCKMLFRIYVVCGLDCWLTMIEINNH